MAAYFRTPYKKQDTFRLESKYKYNEQITSPELRVISEEGEQLGIMRTEEALAYAKERDLDLIEVASIAKPPVARVQMWSKFKFELQKKEKLAKKKSRNKEMKEMWFQPLIGKGDLDHKILRIKDFLQEKHNVKIVIKMRGRVNYTIGKDLMNSILELLKDCSTLESEAKFEPRQIFAILRPGKVSNKEKNEN